MERFKMKKIIPLFLITANLWADNNFMQSFVDGYEKGASLAYQKRMIEAEQEQRFPTEEEIEKQILKECGLVKITNESGTTYTTQKLNDETRISGFNYKTGSQWDTTIKPNGDMRGMDSKNNLWSYDAQSGNYSNSNGHGCIGKGNNRYCY